MSQLTPAEDFNLNDRQRLQIDCTQKGTVHRDKKAISQFLTQLKWPLVCLDIEGYRNPLPEVKGDKPYQLKPFAFCAISLERDLKEPGLVSSFVFTGEGDSRSPVYREIKAVLARAQTILVFNRALESYTINDLGSRFLDLDWSQSVVGKMIDVWKIFKQFHYYHPQQLGKTNLKVLSRVLLGAEHWFEAEENGFAISQAYLRARNKLPGGELENNRLGDTEAFSFEKEAFSPNKEEPEEDPQAVFKRIETYCYKDTLALLALVRKLKEETEK